MIEAPEAKTFVPLDDPSTVIDAIASEKRPNEREA
jgi:hypothetical protein